MRIWATLCVAIGLAGCTTIDTPGPASRRAVEAEITLPPTKQFARTAPQAPQRSNANIAVDFLDLHFALESGRTLPRFTRFEEPITVVVTGTPTPTMLSDLDRLLERIRKEARIDISRVSDPEKANLTVQAVPRSEIRKILPEAACFVVPNVSSLNEYRQNRRSERINWATMEKRDKVGVFVPNDTSPQDVRDCLHEEIAQALGPLNDLYRLPDSVFNDDNVHAVLTGFDMLILRATYAPELQSGMSREEVSARLPRILARMNPAGERLPKRDIMATPRSWSDPIHTVLGPGASFRTRRNAARAAVAEAERLGWTDHRRAFSHYLLGRIVASDDPLEALGNYQVALGFLQDVPSGGLHAAFIIAQTAGFAVTFDDTRRALEQVRPAIVDARNAENAALLSVLLLTKAEAQTLDGEREAADKTRMDALGWARYGFGTEWAARAGLLQIAREEDAAPSATRARAGAGFREMDELE